MSNIHPYLTNGRKSDQSIWELVRGGKANIDGGAHKVGTRAALEDGRVFYYARNRGAAIVAGNLLTAELQTAQFADLATADGVVAGDTTITPTLGSTAVTVNEYAGGYVIVNDDTGEGITYEIKSHPAASGAAACVLTLEDPVNVDFAAGTTVTMMKNLWGDVIISPAGAAHIAVGVSNMAVPAGTTDPQYFWCQTWGIASVWFDEILTIGQLAGSGPDTAGQVGINNGTTEQIVGQATWTTVAGENNPLYLTIAP
jgi:hypothetical protein